MVGGARYGGRSSFSGDPRGGKVRPAKGNALAARQATIEGVTPTDIPRRYLSVREVAAELGISERTVERRIRDEVMPLPAFKMGHGPNAPVRIDPVELARWLEGVRL
jgi:excisionase family DNA binding protein